MIEQKDIENLGNPSCELCKLHKTSEADGKRLVCLMGKGKTNSPVVFVGEALGKNEVLKETPFIGMAGDMFNRAVIEAGYLRKDLFITNSVRCRPPDNKKPTPTELKACRTYLEKELNLIKPKIIGALGSIALNQLTNSKLSITKVRGKLLWSDEFNCNIFPIFHPAYILRNRNEEPVFQADVAKVLKLAFEETKGEKKQETLKHTVIRDIETFRKFYKYLIKCPELAVDIETDSLNAEIGVILCVSFSPDIGKSVIVPILGRFKRELWNIEDKKEIESGMKDILESGNISKIMHNGKFDTQFFIYGN